MELLRPILELGVVIPGMLLACFPVKSSLKQPLSKLVLWLAPLLALLCAAGGVVCYARRMPTAPMLAGLTLLAVVIYIKTLRISLWKSGTIALSVCAVFACINSLCQSDQRRYAGRFAAGAGCAMVLSAGRDLLSCDLLAVCRHRLLSYDAQCAEDGRGRKFCTDLVCVLGAAAGVHCAESVYDSQVCGHALYRACFAGVFCDLHRTFVFDAFLQRNLPSDGNQHQPECEIAAGEPAAFHAAAALRKPESCH